MYANIKESETPIRIFKYKPTRAGDNPQKFLEGFSGYVITDGYAGYDHLKELRMHIVGHTQEENS